MKYFIIILIVAASFLVWQQAQAKPKNTPGPQPEPEKKPAPPLFVAPLVEQLPPVIYEGKAIKGSSPEVYVVKSGSRIYIPNEWVLKAVGFSFRDVVTVSDSVLNSIPLYVESKPAERITTPIVSVAPQYTKPVDFESPIVRQPVRFDSAVYDSPL